MAARVHVPNPRNANAHELQLALHEHGQWHVAKRFRIFPPNPLLDADPTAHTVLPFCGMNENSYATPTRTLKRTPTRTPTLKFDRGRDAAFRELKYDLSVGGMPHEEALLGGNSVRDGMFSGAYDAAGDAAFASR